MGQVKNSNKGTISKVSSADFEKHRLKLTKEEFEYLWNQHNTTLQKLQSPTDTYTRYTSDLILSLTNTSEKLILAGAIPEATSQKDTASYVWKKLKENNIPYSRQAFYKLFKPEQKRDWQTGDPDEGTKQKHKHEFLPAGKINGMGEVSRCDVPCIPACTAMLIEGRLFEQQELQEKEPELKIIKPKSNFEEQNEDFIETYEGVINRLKSVVSVWKTTDSKLTEKEKTNLKFDLYHLRKSGEFLDMCYDRKNLIDPLTQHLLSIAYSAQTQNHAGGVFLMERIDLAKRKHGESVKFFKKAGEFAKLLSGKQTTKAMRGKIRQLNQRYEPQNEKEAMDALFSGQQCTNCNYWRVGYDQVLNKKWKEGDPVHEKYDTNLICFHCNTIQKKIHFTLPKQVPPVTIDFSDTV